MDGFLFIRIFACPSIRAFKNELFKYSYFKFHNNMEADGPNMQIA